MIIKWILLAVIVGLIILCFCLRDHLYPDTDEEANDITGDLYRSMSRSGGHSDEDDYFEKVAKECHGTDGDDDMEGI